MLNSKLSELEIQSITQKICNMIWITLSKRKKTGYKLTNLISCDIFSVSSSIINDIEKIVKYKKTATLILIDYMTKNPFYLKCFQRIVCVSGQNIKINWDVIFL